MKCVMKTAILVFYRYELLQLDAAGQAICTDNRQPLIVTVGKWTSFHAQNRTEINSCVKQWYKVLKYIWCPIYISFIVTLSY